MHNDSTRQKLTEELVLGFADSMAAAASSFNQQTYDAFISSREQLKSALKQLFAEVSKG